MSKYQGKDIDKFAEMFKALANPNRLKIFLRLTACCRPGTLFGISDSPEPETCACVSELGQDLGIGAPTISHHIKELRRAGLIRCERQGQKVECFVDPEAVEALRSFLA